MLSRVGALDFVRFPEKIITKLRMHRLVNLLNLRAFPDIAFMSASVSVSRRRKLGMRQIWPMSIAWKSGPFHLF
ncbi:hypothetical protein PCAR4_1370012 [Paraburkholderia caribensis]|nr:hypothetical protein PCAR4_1370012 [Paraburkholderia caribensis]